MQKEKEEYFNDVLKVNVCESLKDGQYGEPLLEQTIPAPEECHTLSSGETQMPREKSVENGEPKVPVEMEDLNPIHYSVSETPPFHLLLLFAFQVVNFDFSS
ncbi:hypothetical protein PoB_000176900 [Plakobranchus ocellatus]|uniref:Uncharacterized protein n=1 Tax=Plakobranchus ocellatus TaxID=259542 RepID=A0AAV3XZW3_9GAST|nr:hypothetical protein PoB_000176900 [Plakobranchus ocellatus]